MAPQPALPVLGLLDDFITQSSQPLCDRALSAAELVVAQRHAARRRESVCDTGYCLRIVTASVVHKEVAVRRALAVRRQEHIATETIVLGNRARDVPAEPCGR